MEAHASSGPYLHRPRSADTRSIGGALLGAGAISGVAAGMVMALWQMVVGAIALLNSAIVGVVGVTLATSLLGRRPNAIAAIALGIAFGLVLEAVAVNLVVNQIQDVNTVYTSAPEWSWWIAHGLFGATLGLIGSTVLRRRPG